MRPLYECDDFGAERLMSNANNDPRMTGSLEEQLAHGAEELITGNLDEPPLSVEAVLEMVRVSVLSSLRAL